MYNVNYFQSPDSFLPEGNGDSGVEKSGEMYEEEPEYDGEDEMEEAFDNIGPTARRAEGNLQEAFQVS
jgi:hypothetical protein